MAQSVVDLFQQLARNEFGFFSRLQTIAEIMSTSVPSIHSDVTLGDVIGRRDPMTLGSMVVMDSERRDLIGLLRHSTILRCLPRYVNTLKESDRDRTILAANICEFVTRRSPHVRPSATPLDALEIMVREHCNTLLVYDEPTEIKGIVTPVNFACTMLLYYRVFQTLQPLQRLRLVDLDSNLSLDEIFCRGAQTARDVMRTPVTLSASEPVACAIKLMQEERVDFVALLDETQRPVSVVSRYDILMALQPPAKATLIEHGGGLPPIMELLATGSESALAEPVTSVARSRVITAAPTSRLAETLALLAETGRDAVLIQDNNQLVGMVTVAEVMRVFRTLMRLQLIKEK